MFLHLLPSSSPHQKQTHFVCGLVLSHPRSPFHVLNATSSTFFRFIFAQPLPSAHIHNEPVFPSVILCIFDLPSSTSSLPISCTNFCSCFITAKSQTIFGAWNFSILEDLSFSRHLSRTNSLLRVFDAVFGLLKSRSVDSARVSGGVHEGPRDAYVLTRDRVKVQDCRRCVRHYAPICCIQGKKRIKLMPQNIKRVVEPEPSQVSFSFKPKRRPRDTVHDARVNARIDS